MTIVLTTRQYVDVAIRGVKEVHSSDEDVFAVVREGTGDCTFGRGGQIEL
jgi:hypothetical protein